MEDKKEPFDFEAFSREVAEGLKSGKPLVGQNGLFTPLLKHLVEAS
jgi:putative transposase